MKDNFSPVRSDSFFFKFQSDRAESLILWIFLISQNSKTYFIYLSGRGEGGVMKVV